MIVFLHKVAILVSLSLAMLNVMISSDFQMKGRMTMKHKKSQLLSLP